MKYFLISFYDRLAEMQIIAGVQVIAKNKKNFVEKKKKAF